jgi:cysteine desulfurase family protein
MIYLNNGATSFPKPQSVIDTVNDSIVNPVTHAARTGLERELDDKVYLTRKSLAKLFNIDDPLQIIFTSGSTEALNLVISGLDLNGKHVVSTGIEHNSVIRPLKTLEREGVLSVDFVPCDNNAYVSPEQIRDAMRDETKLVVVNHTSNVTGTILDLAAIAEIAHENDAYFLVDASQSAGAVPIDFDGWNIDFLAFTGHKSLYGIQGTGGLVMRKGLELRPLKVGGTGILSEVLYQPDGMPIHYEAGTPNTPGIVALGAGVDWVLETGIDSIHSHKKKLFEKAYSALSQIDGIKLFNNAENIAYSSITFTMEGMTPEECGYMLDSSFDILVRTGIHCAPLLLGPLGVEPWGTIRASHSYFTTEEEMDKFIDAVTQIRQFLDSKKK